MFDEVKPNEPNEPNDEPDWYGKESKYFLNKYVSSDNRVYQIDKVIFRDENERELPTNDPVCIDMLVQLIVTGWRQDDELYSEMNRRGEELFGDDISWTGEVNETELCFVW
jgi:hypothetical protein